MSISKFEKFLKEKDTEVMKIDWNEKKYFFIEKIDNFYSQVNEFIEPYKDKVRINNEEYAINEEYIGRYQTIKMVLHIKNNDIIFTPIGTNLIGACGRIDMEGSNGVVKFVLVPENSSSPKIETTNLLTEEDKNEWKKKQDEISEKNKQADKVWKIATPPPNIGYISLNQETFINALMEVING